LVVRIGMRARSRPLAFPDSRIGHPKRAGNPKSLCVGGVVFVVCVGVVIVVLGVLGVGVVGVVGIVVVHRSLGVLLVVLGCCCCCWWWCCCCDSQ